tara:strand:+ start:13420 stop:16503 length:3084 start_codon:yes stop_codon:yes gene_type:complete
MVLLAKGLSRRGHTVCIYTGFDVPEGTPANECMMRCQDGVFYFPNDNDIVSSIIRARQPEVFISLRHFPVMNWADLIDCKLRILWNEDLLSLPAEYYSASWQTDLHAFVSDYHLEQYCREIPDIRDVSWATINPVDCDRVFAAIEGVERDPKRLIHISRPERALVKDGGSPLLEIFAKMRERDPELTLGICRYHSMYEDNPGVKAVCERADEIVAEAEGVEWLGELAKDDLYRAIAGSALMLYPGVADFAETGCIAATEAQLCETPFIGTRIGALPETLHPGAGFLIEGNCTTDDYQERFVIAATALLRRDPDGGPCQIYRTAQRCGLAWATDYDLGRVAEKWEKKILGMFDARFKARKDGVFKRLVMQDDLRGARQMAAKHYDDPAAWDEIAAWEGQQNESPQSYFDNAVDPAAEINASSRFQVIGHTLRGAIPDWETWDGRVLNYASGNGSLAAVLLKALPCATVLDVDFSEPLIEQAREFITERFEGGAYAARYETHCGSAGEMEAGAFDLVVAGEIAEHYEKPEKFLAELEKLAKPASERRTIPLEGEPTITTAPGGMIFCTVPQGAFRELMHKNSLDWDQEVRGHKFSFEKRDIEEMVGKKPEFDDVHIRLGESQRSTLIGHYIFHWRRDDGKIGVPDVERKIRRMRPRDTLSVCVIARNSENDIARMLKSVDEIADEIWVADTGSKDATMHIAEPYTHNGGGVFEIGRCPDAPPEVPPPGDFGWARNESIKHATGDWILWIDCDETLESPYVMARYMTDNTFNGYALRQCHVMKDAPFRFDKPIRMFRRVPRGKQAGQTYLCQGAIHEHFQPSLNDLIEPALMVEGGDIIHLGYINEGLRREKCEGRNIPHLVYDREKNPDRLLGHLLEAREYCNYARWEKSDTSKQTGNPNPPVVRHRSSLMRGLEIISEMFFDPTGKYWEPAFEVYQDTLKLLGIGSDFLVADFDQQAGEMVNAKLRFLNPEHHTIYVQHTLKLIEEHGTRPPITWDASEDVEEGASAPVAALRPAMRVVTEASPAAGS